MKKQEFVETIKRSAKRELDEKDLSFFGSIGDAIEQAFAADSVERNKKLDNLSEMVGSFEEGKSAAAVVRALAQKVDDLEKKTKRGFSDDEKFKLRSMLESKKDEIIRARDMSKNEGGWAIEFKARRAASALMTTSTVLTGAQAINNVNVFDDLEVLVIRYPKNFIIDAIGGRQVSKVPQTIRWKEQAAESDGKPAVVTEGSVKPLTDKAFVWKYSTRKKYAGRIEFTEELTMDFDQLLLQIIDMFEQQVIREWNIGVQTEVVAWAPAYSSTSFNTYYKKDTAGISEVILAGKTQVLEANYEPDMVMLNPVDAAKAMIRQNANGDIVYLPEQIAFQGLTPFVSNHITAGTIVVGSSMIVKEQHSGFIVRRGVYGDQFIHNEETIVGEVFSNLSLPTLTKASWVKLDVATVKAAIEKAS